MMNDETIICRCEDVKWGEIRKVLDKGYTSLNEIKRLTRAGMGRCQGGYCTLRILKILAGELGIPYEQITKSGYNSSIVSKRMI